MDLKKVLNSAEPSDNDSVVATAIKTSSIQTLPPRPVLAKSSRILSSSSIAPYSRPLSSYSSSSGHYPPLLHSGPSFPTSSAPSYERSHSTPTSRPLHINSQESYAANRPHLPSSNFSQLLSANHYRVPPVRQTSDNDHDGPASVAASDASSNQKPCLWQRPFCNMTFSDDQALYDHVNQVHIGRKKTDNLCLSCHWKNCNVVCSKRDHITSHIKVHIPVKPYKCKKCPRSFKRAQDLTKHVRSHDDLNKFHGNMSPLKGAAASIVMNAPVVSSSGITSNATMVKSLISSRHGSLSNTSNPSTVSTPESTAAMSTHTGLDVDDSYPIEVADGYMSDPGTSDAALISALTSEDIWLAKSLSKKRKRGVIDAVTSNQIKLRRIEKSIHLLPK